MTRHTTLLTHCYVFLIALAGHMPDLIALKAKFFSALKRVMAIFATQDAVKALAVVGTVPLNMAELLAVAAFDCRVFIRKITRYLSFQLLKFIIRRVRARLFHLAFFNLLFIKALLVLLFEVLVSSKSATWNQHVRVKLGGEARNIRDFLLFLG